MAHPVNVFRFCPLCGSSRFRPAGKRSLLCGDCGLHYYINAAAAVAALIFNAEGKLLMTRRAVDPDKGKLDLPGGFVDPGESAEDALQRELREELGVGVNNLVYLTSRPNEYLFSGLTVYTADLVFKAEISSSDELAARDDISSFEWIDPAAVDPDEIPAPSIRYFVKEIATRV